jgi:6-pyruvoyltetrahydropterin/6-carboxytetrahydropterin synthase
MLTLTRKIAFTAGHIYRGGGLGAGELDTLFGIAAEPSGHGHNYVLEVSAEGPVDPLTGMVVNIKDVDAELKKLLAPLDHRMLNVALPEFADGVPTTERLAQVLWARLPKRIGAARCTGLKLEEHPGLYVELNWERPNMVHLTCAIEFAASHRLHSPQLSDEENRRVYGKCNNPNGHGHNYVAEITVAGEPDARSGAIVNVGELERVLKEEIDARFDHKHLNLDTAFFDEKPSTAENIAIVIWELLNDKVPQCQPGGQTRLHRVRLIETARSWFDYYGG